MDNNDNMLPPKIQLPQHLSYKPNQQSKTLILLNSSDKTLVFKIKTNHRSAISILQSHGFIQPNMCKQIPVKLVQFQFGIKLQINYAIANQKMIASNDSHISTSGPNAIKKQFIRKQVIDIKVDKSQQLINSLLLNVQQKQQNKEVFASFFQQKPESKQDLKIQNLTVKKKYERQQQTQVQVKQEKPQIYAKQQTNKYFAQVKSEQISLIQRPDQQQAQQMQQKCKKAKEELKNITGKVESYKKSQKFSQQLNIWIIIGAMAISFLIGGAVKSLLMSY